MSGKKCVFKSRLKRSDSTAGSRNESGSEFQTVGPATEKARVPKCCDETAEYSVCDGWPNADVGVRKLGRLARNNRRGTLVPGTENTMNSHGKLAESSFSADHHATAVKNHSRVSGFL